MVPGFEVRENPLTEDGVLPGWKMKKPVSELGTWVPAEVVTNQSPVVLPIEI